MLIKFEIDKFRSYIKDKKDKIRTTKNIVDKLIKEDQEMEEVYIDEISKELEKMEKEEEKNIQENKEKNLSQYVSKIEEDRNKLEDKLENKGGVNKDI